MEGDIAKLISSLTEEGGRTSSSSLRAKLKWERERYRDVVAAARAVGTVGVGRGRGGIIFLTDSATTEKVQVPGNEEAQKAAEAEYLKERAYYEQLRRAIEADWVADEGLDSYVVEVTADRRVRGVGRWTVPDIVFVGKIVRQFVPGFDFYVQSLEVKRFEAVDALAVFEALNHRRAVHYSYLCLVNVPKKLDDRAAEKLGQIRLLCEEHGVGLITISKGDEERFDEWVFELDPERNDCDPNNLDGFIKQYLSGESKDAIAKMVR